MVYLYHGEYMITQSKQLTQPYLQTSASIGYYISDEYAMGKLHVILRFTGCWCIIETMIHFLIHLSTEAWAD